MARQLGIIKIDGTIEDLSFYRTKSGRAFVRRKGGVDGARIASAPEYARTRENNQEFGSAAKAGKMLRNTIRPLLLNTADELMVSRLSAVMSEIRKLDSTSPRGERNVAVGIGDPQAKQKLKGFNFNIHTTLGAVLKKTYSVLPATGDININNLKPLDDMTFPEGATHVSFRSAWARVDFATGTSSLFESVPVNLKLDNTVSTVKLSPSGLPTGGPGTDLILLKLEFYQEVNGVQYSLKTGAFNVLSIVDVL